MTDKKEIDIYAMAYGGDGIGKIDGKVCFVENALPCERVCFECKENKKNFMRGAAVEILTPSPDRVKPECPYYGTCGGCQYQHLSYAKELEFKAQQAADIIKRIGGISNVEYKPIVPSCTEYGYRSSITLHRSKTGYGYFSNNNKTIIDIDSCPLALEAINRKIPALFDITKKKDVTIKSDQSGDIYISNQPGNRFYTDRFMDTDIMFSPLAFSQANPYIASAMAQWLRESIGRHNDKTLFDLFCGVGLFGIIMRDLFHEVIGIDNSSIAIDCAIQSKRSLGAKNIKFYCSDADKAFFDFYNKKDKGESVIILDPPRSGISAQLAEFISGIEEAKSLYYVSCNPSTLARDAKIIIKKNKWKLSNVTVFDMFPRTMHIETISMFNSQE